MHGNRTSTRPSSVRLIILMLVAALVAGCATTKPQDSAPVAKAKVKAFLKRAQDPRRHWLTVHPVSHGYEFENAYRTLQDRFTRLPFVSSESHAPLVKMSARTEKTWVCLLDTTCRRNWIDFTTAVKNQLVPLDPVREFYIHGRHTINPVTGYIGVFQTVNLGKLRIESFLFSIAVSQNKLLGLQRETNSRNFSAVIGWGFLKTLSFIQIDYPRRTVTMAATTAYKPSDELLIAEAKLRESSGAACVEGLLNGEPFHIILDTAGNYAIAEENPSPEPIKQINLGSLVLRDVMAISATDAQVGLPRIPRIGRKILERFKVTFDNKHHKVWFEKSQ